MDFLFLGESAVLFNMHVAYFSQRSIVPWNNLPAEVRTSNFSRSIMIDTPTRTNAFKLAIISHMYKDVFSGVIVIVLYYIITLTSHRDGYLNFIVPHIGICRACKLYDFDKVETYHQLWDQSLCFYNV